MIELIVVMGIMAIIILIAVPKFIGYTKEARLTKIKASAKEIESASDRYYLKNDDWPRATSEDDYYSKDELESYAKEIYDKTGTIIHLEETGHYYDIDYVALKNYVRVPDDSVKYIIQNPVGRVYYLDKLTPEGEQIVNDKKDTNQNNDNEEDNNENDEDLTDIKYVEKETILNELKIYPYDKTKKQETLSMTGNFFSYIYTLNINKISDATEYLVYRSLSPNIDIYNSYIYDKFNNSSFISSSFSYKDTTHLFKPYYYKIVAVTNDKIYESSELCIQYLNNVPYFNNYINPRLQFKNFNGSWTGLNSAIVSTSEKNANVEIPLIGTGIDINIYGTSTDVDIYIDSKFIKKLDLTKTSTSLLSSIIKNLNHGEYTIKIVNNTSKTLNIGNVYSYSIDSIKPPEITYSYANYMNNIIIKDGNNTKYLIYRSKTKGFNIQDAELIDTIYENLYYDANLRSTYKDMTHTYETYYYKVVGISRTGEQYISNEVEAKYDERIPYFNNYSNPRLQFKNFNGSWTGLNSAIVSTSEKNANVEIPFIGTGFNAIIYGTSKDVSVYVDGEYIKSIDLTTVNSCLYTSIIKNSNHDEHIVKLVNNTNNVLTIGNVESITTNKIYTPSITYSYASYMNRITIKEIYADKYLIYRSKTKEFDINDAELIETYNTPSFSTTYYNFTYIDMTHTYETYYYKVVGVSRTGEQYISNEVEAKYSSYLSYAHNYSSERLKAKNHQGTWTGLNSTILSTNEMNSSFELPLIGTGMDINIYGTSTDVGVYLDGAYIKSINLTGISNSNYTEIIKNLQIKQHTVKLVNNSSGTLNITNIKLYTY